MLALFSFLLFWHREAIIACYAEEWVLFQEMALSPVTAVLYPQIKYLFCEESYKDMLQQLILPSPTSPSVINSASVEISTLC